MPEFDPIVTVDEQNLKTLLKEKLPVALFLFDGGEDPDKPLQDAVNRAAKKHGDDLLIGCIDVAAYPRLHRKYDELQTPAVVTLTKGFLGRSVKSYGEGIRPADLRAHIEYLLDLGPQPEDRFDNEPPAAKTKNGKGGAQHISDSTFRKIVLKSKQPVLVDFWAPWCGPCRALAPYIDEMAEAYKGRVKIVKLNTDENPAAKMSYQVTSIPTLIVFVDGEPLERRTGGSPQVIRDMLEEALLAAQ